MYKIQLSTLLLILFFLLACQTNQKKDNNATVFLTKGTHEAIASEVIQTPSYTYILAKENNVESWIAIPKKEVVQGQSFFYDEGLEMKNFESKSLGRVFETIYFVQDIRDTANKTSAKTTGKKLNKTSGIGQKDISIQQPDGALSVAQIYKSKAKHGDQQITIRGEVVKVNNGIMGVNWVHIQDGSSYDGDYDLTITTQEVCQVGEVHTFVGKISLNKDFGAGYSYPVIMEEGVKLHNQ